MGKIFIGFQTETAQKQSLWGGTNLYGLCKGAAPPPLPPGCYHNRGQLTTYNETLMLSINFDNQKGENWIQIPSL